MCGETHQEFESPTFRKFWRCVLDEVRTLSNTHSRKKLPNPKRTLRLRDDANQCASDTLADSRVQKPKNFLAFSSRLLPHPSTAKRKKKRHKQICMCLPCPPNARTIPVVFRKYYKTAGITPLKILKIEKGFTRNCLRGALWCCCDSECVRSGGCQELLELRLPPGAILPLISLGGQRRGDFCHRFRLDLLCGSGQQFRIPLLEYWNCTITHDLTEASNRVVVDARKERRDDGYKFRDGFVSLLQWLVFFVVDEPSKYGSFDFHVLPPVFGLGMCGFWATIARLNPALF